jgi:universal stress protein E
VDRLKQILVGVDFSPCSAAALQQAVRIGAWNQARVTTLHVVPIPVYAVSDGAFMPVEFPPVDLLLDTAREQWAKWPAAQEASATVTFDTMIGIPRMELLDRVRHESVDLLVLGAHGEVDAKRGVGSTTSACVQRAGTKVLVVREGQTARFRSVVACIDFSDTSNLVLEQAIRIAAQDGAALHILHVHEDPWRGIARPGGVKAHMPDLADRYRRAVERHLRSFCEPLSHELGTLKAALHAEQCDGHGKGILEFVRRQGCDLAVLGTRAKRNLRDFFWGSTAERVVRESPCSVLTVKPPGFQQT